MRLLFGTVPAVLVFLILSGIISGCDSTGASFEEAIPSEFNLQITVEPEEGGTVSPDNGSFISGSQLDLTATASDEYLFDSWSGDHEGSQNPLRLSVNRDFVITAHFVRVGFPLTLDVTGNGKVVEEVVRDSTSAPNTTANGDEPVRVKLEAIPDEGWVFTGWSGDHEGNENPMIISRDRAKSIVATFEESAPSIFEIVQQPSSTPAGQKISPSPAVKITNQTGVAIQGVEVKAELRSGSFSSGSTQTISTDHNGIAEFRDLKINRAGGSYRIRFTASGTALEDIESSSFSIQIGPVDAKNSQFNSSESSLIVGNEAELLIRLKDAGGNDISGRSPDQFQFSGAGRAEIDPVKETDEPGLYKTVIYSSAAESLRIVLSVNREEIQDKVDIRFEHGPPYSMEKVSGDGQSTGSNEEISEPLTVRVEDRFGNPVAGERVSFSIVNAPRTAQGATLGTEQAETDSEGMAYTTFKTGNRHGQYRIEARTGTLSPVVFSVRARR
ncbi:MAG: Ig-like domain-containing protein [Balneolaceae bacterium]|nr:Ig-like domain-containing protein [Balneolaceae bacterium]MCH8547464.1 Ig-like domain-containing protein [Balneolaceae bacterium]